MKTVCSLISPVSLLMKAAVDEERTREGHVLLFALVLVELGLLEAVREELESEVAGEVLDRRDVPERLA